MNENPHIPSDRPTPPLTQLKLRSPEEREWAFNLSNQMKADEAIAVINEELDINLKWESSYSRFLSWQHQQHCLEDIEDTVRQFAQVPDPAVTCEQIRAIGLTVLMHQACQNKDTRAFVALNRLLLAREKHALAERKQAWREKEAAERAARNAQKLELAQRAQQEDHALAVKKVELVEKKINLEVRKYDDAQKAAQAPEKKPLTEDERCAKIKAIFGM